METPSWSLVLEDCSSEVDKPAPEAFFWSWWEEDLTPPTLALGWWVHLSFQCKHASMHAETGPLALRESGSKCRILHSPSLVWR